MDVIVLLIDVPEHRPPRPLRANERVFTAHRVEIAAPQQMVVLVLPDERQHLHRERIAHVNRADRQGFHLQPARHIAENPPFRNHQVSRPCIGRQHIQPTGQPGVFISKQRD